MARRPTWATGIFRAMDRLRPPLLCAVQHCRLQQQQHRECHYVPLPVVERRHADYRSVLRGGHQLPADQSDAHHPAERDLRFQSTSIKNLIMNGQFSYSRMNDEHAQLLETCIGPQRYRPRLSTSRQLAPPSARSTTPSYGVIWEVAKNFDLEDQVTLSANGQPGNVNTSGYTKLVTGTAADKKPSTTRARSLRA